MTKETKIFQKKIQTTEKMAKMFFEFMHEKTNLLEKSTTKKNNEL